ncbi:hypothetical protein ABMA27_010433 [Loxostege sticticalis]|uniref:CCHC-type domain-containing protein n=1 Tax=Loxostege sticticalis TaxID=481309 RepID=A0ABR3H5R1_LOXSC
MASFRVREQTAQELVKAVRTATETVAHCTKRSGNISGVFQRNLNDATALIQAAVDSLAERTVNDEIRRLNLVVERLTKENGELRKESAILKEQQVKEFVVPTTNESPMEITPAVDEPSQLERNLTARWSAMMNARFEGIEGRLLPEQRRIPLAADKRREARPSFAEVAGSSKAQPAKAVATKASPAKTLAAKAPAAKAPGKKPQGGQTARPNAPPTKPAAKKPVTPKLRPPRSSAIVLTLLPGAQEKGVTYETALRDAKSRINISELGISGLRCVKAKTGGKLLEIPGATSGDKADALAAKLKEVLPEELVRISRPTKTVDVRLSGLDDSVTKEEVAEAVSRVGGCAAASIKVGEIRESWAGNGTVVVKVPVAAAKKVAQGRLLVGWVSCRVQVLETKPMRCYRCMESGHVRQQCPNETDRSEMCYRCGGLGHKARDCTAAAPHCPVCADSGKPADHKVGSKNCAPPKRGKASKPVPTRSTGDSVAAMDTS